MSGKNLQFNDEISYVEDSNQEENYSSSEESINRDPIKMTTKYHEQQSHEALQSLKDIVKEKIWKKVLMHKSGLTVYSKPGTGKNVKTPIYMARHEIKGFTPQSIFAVIGMRKLWDEWYDEGSLVENLNETTSLTYIVMNGLAGSKPRDMSLVEKIECTSNGTIYFVSTSVNTSKVPRIVGKDRTTLLIGGWIIEPISISPLNTRVTYVHQSRIRGWIPSVIAKKYLARRPLALHTIDTYLQKNGPPKIYIRSSRNSGWSNFSNISFETSEDNHDDNVNVNDKRLSIHDYNVNLKDFNIENNDDNTPNIDNYNNITSENNNNDSNNNNSNNKDDDISNNLISSNNKVLRRKISTVNEEEKTSSQPKEAEARVAPEYTPELIHSVNDDEKFNTLITNNNNNNDDNNEANEKVLIKEHITPEYSPVETPVESLPPPKISQPPEIEIEEEILPSSKQEITHKYTEASRNAFERLKSLSNLSGWNLYCENKGVKIYQKDSGRTTPMVRGDSIITGFSVEEILSVAINLDFRKLWDERYEEGSNIESWGLNEMLTRTAMKGNFLVSGRDLSLFSRIDRDPETGTVWFTNTSVIDPAIPENKKYVRANLITAGWILKPNFNSSKSVESVNVIYLVDVDVKLDTVPSSILKTLNLQIPMCVQRANEVMNKYGFPPFISRLESIKLIDNGLDIKSFQCNFIFKTSKEEGIIEIHTSKKMYPNGFDVTIISQNVKVEIVPNRSELFRITKIESDRIEEIQVQITKYTSGKTRITYNGNKVSVASASPKKIIKVIEKSTSKNKLIDQKITTPENALKTTTPENTRKITIPANTLKTTTPENTLKTTTPKNTLKTTTPENTLKPIPVNDSKQIDIRHIIQEKTSNPTLIVNEDTVLPQRVIQEKISNSTLVEEEDIIDPQLIIDDTSYPKHLLEGKSLFVNGENKDLDNDNEVKIFEEEKKRLSNKPIQQPYLEDAKTTSIKNDENNNNPFNFDNFFKNINLNNQQIGIIFVSMVLSYYAGKLSGC